MYEQKRSRYECVSSKNISVERGLKTILFIAMYYVDFNCMICTAVSRDQQTGFCSQFFETVKTFNLSIVVLGQFLDDLDGC